MIYVYELWDNNLGPVTSVVCPRRVLAMSMDASARRFSVAALLDGRMGLVCDLHHGLEDTAQASGPGKSVGSGTGNRQSGNPSLFTSRLYPAGDDRTSILDSSSGRDDWPRGTVAQPIHSAETWNLHLGGKGAVLSGVNEGHSSPFRPGVPVETGPRSIYRHLCSDDDPPRSVAICPQQRCVAFGCASGVELHWVDALSGQDFNRWFPLATPSDCLYFLPPRRGVDSAKKLRLISSTAHPNQRVASRGRQPGKACLSGKFWSLFGTEARSSSSERARHSPSPPSGCDHYNAVPLSDGYHVLFTDPASNTLCLGSDAPFGSPTKLLRKVVFEPPEPGAVSFLYAASAELRWGPRVVAAYGDRVVLYSVPPDVFAVSVREQQKTRSSAPNAGTLDSVEEYTHWKDWLPPSSLTAQPCFTCRRDSPWPVLLKGTVVGSPDRLVELAVHSSPDLTVWAFGLDGRAAVWQVGKPWRAASAIVERSVTRDGLVCEGVDADGDVGMVDVGGERSVGSDGHESGFLGRAEGGLHVRVDDPVGTVEVLEEGVWYDGDGDVVMGNAPLGCA
ncbi:hypothetical protein H2201_001064 [Coniosporium apollinis]|uniref:Uncharacterized protein n=1 Tax=Coniosporium apollinis TaxID=61459 RepID=A0ABQ9P3G8_9PEZI|nr:hypothetical protein H2201_001064 [Coniosporium apollinis]